VEAGFCGENTAAKARADLPFLRRGGQMSIFVLGDPHLSLGSQKPMDVFEGWGNYTERIKSQWRDTVTEGDTVVLAGDISWAMSLDEARADFAFLEALPGSKIILKGNHDYWWATMKKMNDWLEGCGFSSMRFLFNNSYIAEGFGICGTRSWSNCDGEPDDERVFAREIGRLRASIASLDLAACSDAAVFLHYPPVHRSGAVEEIVDIIRASGIKKCYYGHLHGASVERAYNGEYRGVHFKLVSADYLKFAPYKIR
jgi:predicted phosphohydrolase